MQTPLNAPNLLKRLCTMLMFSLAIIVGLIFLVVSADRFVAGAAAIANNFGVPHIIIGVTIVSLGT